MLRYVALCIVVTLHSAKRYVTLCCAMRYYVTLRCAMICCYVTLRCAMHCCVTLYCVRVLLYTSSHRQDNTYHGLCYTSRGALAGT